MVNRRSASTARPLGEAVIREVLTAAGERPAQNGTQAAKIRYASRFADAMAQRVAADLAAALPGTEATAARKARSEKGNKQLDINFSTPALGLAVGISFKSVHIRESGAGYTHNLKRNEEELRIEASGYHRRQPYAVMIGVLFLPFDSCHATKPKSRYSSFGSWVRHLRPYTGRTSPQDDPDRFERIFIALYDPEGSDIRFFDVAVPPPRLGPPPLEVDSPFRAISYEEFLQEVHREFLKRNRLDFSWADGDAEPLGGADPGPVS